MHSVLLQFFLQFVLLYFQNWFSISPESPRPVTLILFQLAFNHHFVKPTTASMDICLAALMSKL